MHPLKDRVRRFDQKVLISLPASLQAAVFGDFELDQELAPPVVDGNSDPIPYYSVGRHQVPNSTEAVPYSADPGVIPI